MRTTTARIFEVDIERARVIGAVRQQSAHEVLHAALDEYVTHHRIELEGLFNAVQAAVLSGDADGLREAFLGKGAPHEDEDARRAQSMWESE